MARSDTDGPLTPSLLDRLIDDEDARARDQRVKHYRVHELTHHVLRDLRFLIGTPLRNANWPAEFDELSQSLVNYGLPDLVGADLEEQTSRSQYLDWVAAAIERFEPRLRNVRIYESDVSERLDRQMRFEIRADLHWGPADDQVVFDSLIDPTTGSLIVKGVTT